MAISKTIGPSFLGTAMTSGLLPSTGSLPPHAGMLGVVLVKHIPIHPASTACQPKLPPLIQWLVFFRDTQPMPLSFESWIALSMQWWALRLPAPRCPSHRSKNPKLPDKEGLALTSTIPSRIILIKEGKRFNP